MPRLGIARIVSGGQTGADRGALDAAIRLGIAHGGWCPRGRLAEDGAIPAKYRLRETDSPDYAARTERNVIDSDGTLIISRGRLTGGSALTLRLARKRGRPARHIDLDSSRDPDSLVAEIRGWIAGNNIAVLNIAGPRASNCPGIAGDVEQLVCAVLGGER